MPGRASINGIEVPCARDDLHPIPPGRTAAPPAGNTPSACVCSRI
jgi:hypothetical protein